MGPFLSGSQETLQAFEMNVNEVTLTLQLMTLETSSSSFRDSFPSK